MGQNGVFLVMCVLVVVSAAGMANVRFLNGCVGLEGAVSVAIGSVTISSISFGTISSYFQVPIGWSNLRTIGTKSLSNLNSLNFKLESDYYYTIVLFGDKNLSLKVVVDSVAVDFTSPILRVVWLGDLNTDLHAFVNENQLGVLNAGSTSLSHRKIVAGPVILSIKNQLGVNIFARDFLAEPGKPYSAYLIPSVSVNAQVNFILAEDIVKTNQPTLFNRLVQWFLWWEIWI